MASQRRDLVNRLQGQKVFTGRVRAESEATGRSIWVDYGRNLLRCLAIGDSPETPYFLPRINWDSKVTPPALTPKR